MVNRMKLKVEIIKNNKEFFEGILMTVFNKFNQVTHGYFSLEGKKENFGILNDEEFFIVSGDGRKFVFNFNNIAEIRSDNISVSGYCRFKRKKWSFLTIVDGKINGENISAEKYRQQREEELKKEIEEREEKLKIVIDLLNGDENGNTISEN
jgi:hypothetical protein